MRNYLRALFIAALGLLNSSTIANAQPIGIAAMLNPEGTRLFPQSIIAPRHPGKPDLRWRDFDWEYIDRDLNGVPIRLYFYKEELWTAEYALPQISEQIERLSKIFDYKPTNRFSYLIFASQREFKQAHVFDISEGVQGVTATEEATMAIPYWGEAETFRHISTHELVHQFQVQRMNKLSENSPQAAGMATPLWLIEGMAEYYSQNGIDTEAECFLRDMVLHPDPGRDYKAPDFLDEGPYDYFHIYKMGQARVDFLESVFGKDTAPRLFDALARGQEQTPEAATEQISKLTALKASDVQAKWNEYLNKRFKGTASRFTQSVDQFEIIKEAGENLDSFDIAPNGERIAIREVDPLIGTTSITLIDLKDGNRRTEIAQDTEPNLLSLHFMQFPVLTISNNYIAYVVETTSGPELEIKELRRSHDGHTTTLNKTRIKLHKSGLIQAASPTFSPDEKNIAFIGMNKSGWQNIYRMELGHNNQSGPKQLTNSYYSWRNLEWTEEGILGASDRTNTSRYGIFLFSPDTKESHPLRENGLDAFMPSGRAHDFVYQSDEKGSYQIRRQNADGDQLLTNVNTLMSNPKLRGNQVYALGFFQGRYHLYRIGGLQGPKPLQTTPIQRPGSRPPWTADVESLSNDRIHAYKPFSSSGTRVDNLGGFLSTGGIGGISGTFSDLMRNYSVSAEFSVLGDIRYTNAYAFLSSQKGRATWTTGLYHVIQSRLDTTFSDNIVRSFLQREFGILGAVQYPMAAFSYVDFELRLGSVKRTEYSDYALAASWEAQNPGGELLIAPMARIGYDRIIYETFTGPIKGFGVLIEADTSIYPERQDVSERLRFDSAWYLKGFERTVLAMQLMSGVSFGGQFTNPFFVSSDDIMRAYPFFDPRLYGNYMMAGKAELRYPIGSLFKFPPLRGFFGYDLGTIAIKSSNLGRNVNSSYTGGLSMNIPPLSINFMLSYPIRVAPGPMDRPIFHFTLRYLYL